ncbi:MAG TPA: ABC transporter permease, partial [Vicinamibacterales bacterium]|nr:ABC transporter permease [Vicinamibacterales bacterium]
MGLFSWLKRRLQLDEEDFDEEIRAHLAIASADKISDGLDPEEARYAALREFGNVTLTTEATRHVWTPSWLDALRDLTSDVRYAVRTLAKNPMFSLAVIAVLTVGIGLNATVFTMLKGFALSPIAGVSGSARLTVMFGETSTGRQVRVSYPDYQYLRDHDRAFTALVGSIPASINLGKGRSARQIWGELVSGNYFQVLGVRAQHGRTLLPSDEAGPGRQPVVVISDGLWRRDFGADPSIVGKTLDINNNRLTVVGVADPSFHGTTVVYDVEVFVPVTIAPQLGFTFGSTQTTPAGILSDRRATVFFPHGYLRPGVTRASAAAQADALWATLSRERPVAEAAERLRVVPFWQTPSGAPSFVLPTLAVLTATALLVLLIACANIAGLVLVRGVSRRGEIALRLALGARRARIVRLLIVENLVLAAPGAVLGVLVARHGIPVFAEYAEWLAAPQR